MESVGNVQVKATCASEPHLVIGRVVGSNTIKLRGTPKALEYQVETER